MISKRTKRGGRSWLWIMVGVLVLLYPLVATLRNNHLIEQHAEQYSQSVQQVEPREEIVRLREEARQYNRWLNEQGHHAMPPVPASPGFDRYMDTLRVPGAGETMGRIRIDSIGVDLPISHTSNPHVLYKGAGHMFGSDLPVGGVGTNAVITAHAGMVDATMFDHLPTIEDGALVEVEVLDEIMYYRVTGRRVVQPDDWDKINYEPDKDKITLVTCTPYGINTDRLLVEAVRVDPPVAEDGSSWRLPLSWWMILDLLLLLGVALLLIVRRQRRRKQMNHMS